ncbi:hypothetical protein IFM46972_07687 [Aspergillus udagawae]|uniref:Uncharacterized protein n=1 Tax=Aspergillus udagawae TaxID=91492 RepID=A0A8H3PAW7_9EURO|nr:hypothetical protein IFM46972_07687 [Aspergillus udagawae]
MNQTVRNVISEDETSYILKEKLEARLRLLFGYPIKVQVIKFNPALPSSNTVLSLTLYTMKHVNGRYCFEAPREVTTSSQEL